MLLCLDVKTPTTTRKPLGRIHPILKNVTQIEYYVRQVLRVTTTSTQTENGQITMGLIYINLT